MPTVTDGTAAAPARDAAPPTAVLLGAMLRAAEKISDLIFSPGRPPLVERDGRLIPVKFPGLTMLTADHTQRIANDLIGQNQSTRCESKAHAMSPTDCPVALVSESTYSCNGVHVPSSCG